MTTKNIRVFLASPGDVPRERKLAREAITHIGSERRFRGRISIEIVAWDQPGAAVAMQAGLTPQDAIAQGLPKPDECDLTVVMLWSRIGTQLSAEWEVKEDGTPYLSGTEWEYLNALNGFKKNRKPSVWVYRRKGSPKLDPEDPEFQAKIDQWNKLKGFFATFVNPDGSLVGGINDYEAADDFRQTFERHLRDWLDKLLDALPKVDTEQHDRKPAATPRWTASPYPGLESFTLEQAAIFFGRGPEVDQLLNQFTDPSVRFIAVVGVSGSGKSSLVMAGLLPHLRDGMINRSPWIDLILKPAERGDNPFLALAFALKSRLEIVGQKEQEFARALQTDPELARDKLIELLAQDESDSELLLVIDQFEELFTQTSADDRQDFMKLLEHIVENPRIRVIVTLRADFYARAIEEPTLAKLLRRDRGTFPLDPPGVGAIHEMITRPAEAAGLELQEGLTQRLLDDAGKGPGAMALIAFTLHQLYSQSKDTRYLTNEAYDAIGGVQGAVQKRAETALQGLKIKLDSALAALFANLVEVNEQEVATRRRAPQSRLTGEVKIAADALTEARLLVTGKGADDEPTLEVAHETVLRGWERLSQWVKDHAGSLRARRDLERVATEWDKSDRHGEALRGGKLLQGYLGAAQPHSTIADAYLAACRGRRRMVHAGFAGLAVLGLLFIAILGFFFQVSKSDYPLTYAANAIFVRWGFQTLPRPEMVEIPAGNFTMGRISVKGGKDELPIHTVTFEKAFEIGKYEVTFDEYDLFAAAEGRDKPGSKGWGRDNRPVINVYWDDATAYAKWLSEQTGHRYRLPSESEWEYAARAGTTTLYSWGDAIECSNARYGSRSGECGNQASTDTVGAFSDNPFGVKDMNGNVWEWTQDCWHSSYEGAPEDGGAWLDKQDEDGDCEDSYRVIRGGSWKSGTGNLRSANRSRLDKRIADDGTGFRLVRDL